MKLPLTRHLLSQPPANSLPLPLARKLGEQAQEQSQDGQAPTPQRPLWQTGGR